MRRFVRGGYVAVWLAVLSYALVPAAAAQVSAVFLDRWDLGFRSSLNSGRLDGMSNVWVAVEDESREINMWDYGRNVAGFLSDRDAWSGDFWAVTRDIDRRAGSLGTSGEATESGIQLSFRSFERALGIEGNLTVGTDDEAGGGDRHKFSGPRVTIVGNHAIGESLIFGLGVTFVNEQEKTTSSDPLSIEHDTARTDWNVGLVYYLGDKIDLGATATITRNRIAGTSEDGLHRDRYDWDRPSADIGAQIVYGAESALQGAAFVRHSTLDGGEELEISWSREFFLNPSGVDLSIRVPVLTEELNQTEFGTRWLLELSEIADVGASVSRLSSDYRASVNPTFPSLSETADEELTETALSAGLAVHPLGALLLAGQLDYGERTLDSIVLEELQTETTKVTTIGVGVEYFVRPDLALRGGARFGTRSIEFDEPGTSLVTTDFDVSSFSGGVGWAPGGGVFVLDAAMSFSDGKIKDSPVVDETNGIGFTLTGRTLFR